MADLPQELSVGEVARRGGVAVSALHFYEREGLIRSSRSAGKAVPGKKTNLVYTADAVRGIEVFEVTLPSTK